MKTVWKMIGILAIAVIAVSCKQQNVKSILADDNLRMGIMDSIANNHQMATEMMNAMMNSNHGKMTIMGNQKMMNMMMSNPGMMQSMMKGNPKMMSNMMGAMMNAAQGDSASMMGMCKKIMGNAQMMGMMHQMMMGQKDSGNGMMR